jgi:hypothetical protein
MRYFMDARYATHTAASVLLNHMITSNIVLLTAHPST